MYGAEGDRNLTPRSGRYGHRLTEHPVAPIRIMYSTSQPIYPCHYYIVPHNRVFSNRGPGLCRVPCCYRSANPWAEMDRFRGCRSGRFCRSGCGSPTQFLDFGLFPAPGQSHLPSGQSARKIVDRRPAGYPNRHLGWERHGASLFLPFLSPAFWNPIFLDEGRRVLLV